MQDPVAHICDAVGEAGLRDLTAAFYRRVRTDAVLAPMYPEADFEGAEQRLAAFLVERCGGPAAYTSTRGHPRLRMRHAPFVVDQKARDHWMACMDGALEELAFAEPARGQLREFLDGVASFLVNR